MGDVGSISAVISAPYSGRTRSSPDDAHRASSIMRHTLNYLGVLVGFSLLIGQKLELKSRLAPVLHRASVRTYATRL